MEVVTKTIAAFYVYEIKKMKQGHFPKNYGYAEEYPSDECCKHGLQR